MIQLINVGLIPNDGTGDNLRNAMIKVNENFQEVINLLNGYSPTGHTHTISDIIGLQNALDTIASDISDIENTLVNYAIISGDVATLQAQVIVINQGITSINTIIGQQNASIQAINVALGEILDQLEELETNGIPEAPEDGQTYGRKDATWVPIGSSSLALPRLVYGNAALGPIYSGTTSIMVMESILIPANTFPNNSVMQIQGMVEKLTTAGTPVSITISLNDVILANRIATFNFTQPGKIMRYERFIAIDEGKMKMFNNTQGSITDTTVANTMSSIDFNPTIDNTIIIGGYTANTDDAIRLLATTVIRLS